MANEIDELMSRDPLLLSAQDIDAIIAYQRNARAARQSGTKPVRGTGAPISLSAIGLASPEKPKLTRRKL